MSYLESIQRLFNVNLFGGIKLGLQNVQRLQQLLDYPDRSFSTIHVAGTNGKGSVCIKMAQAFMQAGYRVGLYTSPHVSCFRERIRVNHQMIPEEEVERLLTFLFKLIDKHQIPATFFEITTFLAFLYFAEQKIDLAIIETGLGGRLDATNIIQPCLSVITSISLDHTQTLGESEEMIAKEKAGIIKDNVPVIIGPHVPEKLMRSIALQKKSPLIQVTQTSPLFEEENRAVARAALEFLIGRFNLSPQQIEMGLNAKQPCRMEFVQEKPPTLLDVAHNPDGLLHLFQSIAHHYPNTPLRILFGLSKSKDVLECLKIIASKGSHFHVVSATNGRGTPVQTLSEQLKEYISSHLIFEHDGIVEGVLAAQKEALKHGEVLVICGTFFIMSQARQALGIIEPIDAIDLNEQTSLPFPKIAK